MENKPLSLDALVALANDIHAAAENLYEGSADFPAVNRNVKRVLAASDMIRLNLEGVADQPE